MSLAFKFVYDREAWKESIQEKHRPVATAAVAALEEAADTSVKEGRRDIAGAGKFGPEWQTGLLYRMKDATDGGEPSLQAKAIVFHKRPLAGVFEYGVTISGKPLLWIPTTPGAPSAGKSGKRLVSATVHGQPMLFDAGDRDPKRKPLYVGVPSVRIEKKWHIVEIVKKNANRIGELFLKNFKGI
jgi:hypothetical protein